MAALRVRRPACSRRLLTAQRKGLATARPPPSLFAALDTFSDRHIGPDNAEAGYMLSKLGYSSMDAFVDEAVPTKVRIPADAVSDTAISPLSEAELLRRARLLASDNKPFKSYIGMGYHNAVVPPVILRNVMENPAWYTQYTPYQAELAQGRLESLATAAAEGMVMSLVAANHKRKTFFVDQGVLPQTLAVLRTRAKGFGIKLVVLRADLCGILLQYPNLDGQISDLQALAESAHAANALVVVATDLLALTMLKPPGEWGADIVLGNSARFGVPAGYGGPHGAFFATTDKLKRKMPGRIIGRSRDAQGLPAYRLALQTREQHIRREKATSNICTSQALLANMAAMYAVYHGPEGLKRIANKVHGLTQLLKIIVERYGYRAVHEHFFDTLLLDVTGAVPSAQSLHSTAAAAGINFRVIDDRHIGVTLDESVGPIDFLRIVNAFSASVGAPIATIEGLPTSELASAIPELLRRTSEYLLTLCTMKLNSTSSMIPLTWPEFGGIHPFAPLDQVEGYSKIISELEADLCKITGFHACSLQPNSGAAGEYAGLCVIRAYHKSRGEGHRDICLIPVSAHGTNPASAVMAGLKVVPVKTLPDGSLDLADLREKAEKHKDNLAAFMITYPSTFGVFEDGACQIIHDNGGQVYLDGANLNAQIGLTNPATCGGDVCHMNLHKTFAIPHGGGGPGMGPICVAKHLAPFLPHTLASILLISWAYIKMLGGQGLVDSSKIALLSANYMAYRLSGHYSLRYNNSNGRVAHELLIDFAEFDKVAGLKVTDFAKRLQDYGFHPPTVSWPISTCMLIEPTESDLSRKLIEVITGQQPRDNNVLKNAPHPMSIIVLSEEEWNRPYSRQKAHTQSLGLRKRSSGQQYPGWMMCDCPSVEESAHDHV
ncbi:glycine dehydrogenase [Gloeopeniophorella convolvens]|nr:glycine dehydrogenase [Gloeopeniophorella convolvens]